MNRRQWLQQGGVLVGTWLAARRRALSASSPFSPSMTGGAPAAQTSHFRLSVITDEITQDFGHAVEVAAKEFSLGYVEIRTLWNKNIVTLDDKEFAEVRRLLDKSSLKVTDIASPLFKVHWPGAPKSEYASESYQSDFSFEQQDEVLERATAAAKRLGTDRVRCFDFWRLTDPKPYRDAMDDRLRAAAKKATGSGIVLLLENEYACNTATGVEAARTIKAVESSNFMLNWDPGNAAFRGETAYPDGYAPIPKNRIGHMHLKDVQRKKDGSYEWAAMGKGIIDYVGQFQALLKDGYSGTMSLETHWKGAGTPEESTRQSMAGTKTLLQKVGALAA